MNSANPIETTMSAIVPVRRRRSGRHSPRSSPPPSNPPATTPTAPANNRGAPGPSPPLALTYQAINAPNVTSSPCAKLMSPVVPNTSDRPTAASATISPNLIPPTARFSSSSKSDGPDGPASPNGNSTNLSPSDWTATLDNV